MSTPSSTQSSSSPPTPAPADLGIVDVLRGAATAVRSAPILLGVFLVSSFLELVIPDPVDSLVTVIAACIGVVIAYRGLGGQLRTDASILRRLGMAGVAMIVYAVLILLGLVALILPGLYVMVRLFLAMPAVMIDGYGPFEALSESWELMDDSVLAAGGALGLMIGGTLMIFVPLLLATKLILVVTLAVALIGGTLSVSIQAFLYRTLSETN